MSLPSWAEVFQDHTGNAEKIKITVENAVFTLSFHLKITKYYHVVGKKKTISITVNGLNSGVSVVRIPLNISCKPCAYTSTGGSG